MVCVRAFAAFTAGRPPPVNAARGAALALYPKRRQIRDFHRATHSEFDLLHYFLPFTGYPYEGAEIDCPVCGSADHARIAHLDRRIKRLSTHLCHHCGLFFTNPMPTEAELERYYAETYRAEYQLAFIRPRKTHQNKKWREAERRAARLKDAAGLDAPGRTLDFGCGSGELVYHLAGLGHEARGFEPGADYGSFAQSRLGDETKSSVHVGSWREMTFAPGSFDVITFLHVLEHLNDPMAALKKCHEWLADDGVLYLETPNMQDYKIKGFDCFHFAHVLGFSGSNLKYAAKEAGFALLHEDWGTSLFLVKSGDPRGKPLDYDLAATVEKNRADYQEGVTPLAYAKKHLKRIRRLVGEEVKQGR